MCTRILIIRTSSLGDLIHVLPAISDISQHVPNAVIDWIVEESFSEVPSWHPSIRRVLTIAHRRWRKSWFSPHVRQERRILASRLKSTKYDIVLDMQGLLKSVWLLKQTNGLHHGLDWCSAREPLSSLFYKVRHRVPFFQPAIERHRQLASLVFGYSYFGKPDFRLHKLVRFGIENSIRADYGGLHSCYRHHEYIVIMPSASRRCKLWSVTNWKITLLALHKIGFHLKLLAGNLKEVEFAEKLIGDMQGSQVISKLNLTSIAKILLDARLMIGLDSGLTHLSAALGCPTIGIYLASTPARTPLSGSGYIANLGDRGIVPSHETVLTAVKEALRAD